jgi:hypothetical protein
MITEKRVKYFEYFMLVVGVGIFLRNCIEAAEPTGSVNWNQ